MTKILRFIDYSSAFNTIVPSKLIIKLGALGLTPALCNWVLALLTGPQVVKVGNNTSIFAYPQHRGPTRVLAQLLPVLPVHP